MQNILQKEIESIVVLTECHQSAFSVFKYFTDVRHINGVTFQQRRSILQVIGITCDTNRILGTKSRYLALKFSGHVKLCLNNENEFDK